MDIIWYGQAAFKLKGKNASVAIDPYHELIGLKPPKEIEADLVLVTHQHKDHNNTSLVSGNPVKIEGPGDYEVKGVAVNGIGVFHDKQKGLERGRNTIYNINIDGLNVVHVGDLGHLLSEAEIQEVGTTDILLVPVGSVFTIDAKEASELIAELEPSIIIPMHYSLPGLKVELDPVEKFLKEMGVENITPVNKLTITKDKLPEEPQVVLLSKT